jgi:Na+/H+ antiporter NhaD/arsenite permease-like protein
MKSFVRFFIKDKVFLIALILAIISTFFIPITINYIEYINFKVLIIMFTLMIAVAGFYETHFFDFIATKLIVRLKNIRWIGIVIIITTFFLSMLLTNDAVLLTLVPFTIFITKHTNHQKEAIIIIILQTIAANLGSALTPMGDPQNIYLYAYYDINFLEFLKTTFPITFFGFILLLFTGYKLISNKNAIHNIVAPKIEFNKLIIYILILLNALLIVLRLINIYYSLIITMIITIIFSKHLFKKVDYHLLLTFVSFFIFTGNLSQISYIYQFLGNRLDSYESIYFTSLVTSQLISNVPAAILLSTFTNPIYYKALLLGVNVGSMGTIIGSLASLISFKYIIKEYKNDIKIYLFKYSIISVIYIVIITMIIFLFYV